MNHGCVTLDEVFAAAAARAASLVPETSGYLALAIGDATSRLPLLHDDCALTLTTEGGMSASRRGDVVAPEKAAKAMRDTLARLLAVSSGSMPSLAAAARPREESARGVDAVIEEIEAALIPVNRAAAQRALARLSRETLRAKEAGKLKPKREASVRPPPRPPVPTAARAVSSEPPVQPVFTEPPPLAPRIEAVILEAKPLVAEAQPAFPDREIVAAEAVTGVPYALPLVLDVALALSPVIEAETLVRPEQAVSALAMSVDPAPVQALASVDSRLEARDFSEPTPTTLGMAIEIDEASTPFTAMDILHPTDLGAAAAVEESQVAVIHARVVEIPVIPAAGFATSRGPKTRADDLLATFAVSCSDAAALREATDCLKKLADLDPTPPPLVVAPPVPARAASVAPVAAAPKPARAAPAPTPLAAPKGRPALDALRDQLEEQGRSPRKRGRSGLGLVAALLGGAVVGLVAVTQLRPDLVTSFEERVGPALGSERSERTERPAPPAPAARPR